VSVGTASERVQRLALQGRPGAVPLGATFGAMGLLAGLAVSLLHLDRLPFAFCTFKAATGWPCLTCGSTRALGRLLALDVPGALALNPLATLAGLLLVPWALADLVLLTRGRALALELGPRGALWLRLAVGVALLANWAYLIAAGR
jgi:uncharacterized protein DUF2752